MDLMIPTSTNVSVRVEKSVPAGAEGVAVFIGDKHPNPEKQFALVPPSLRPLAQRLAETALKSNKPGELASSIAEDAGRTGLVIIVSIGPADRVDPEAVRRAAGAVAKTVRKQKLNSIALIAPVVDKQPRVGEVVSGFLLASFRFTEFKGAVSRSKPEDAPQAVRAMVVVNDVAAAKPRADRARIIAEGQNFARTLASRPGNSINPPALAALCRQSARELKVACRVLDDRQMQRLNMGGILAVGSASAAKPRMIVLEYKPRSAKNKRPLLVIGKTITFDSGGISIKPAEKMGRMIYDKSGGMAVLGLMYALSKLRSPVHVVGILAAAENVLGSTGYRPGDILSMHNGVTVKVTNTDAEGRLVLADALAWGIATYKPRAAVDLATLTGGVIVALGKTMAGIMGNDDALLAEMEKAAGAAGEKVWRLPVGDDQRDLLKSELADIVNAGAREASPLQGGAFLSYFIPQEPAVPWVHVNIAGVADTEKDLPYYAKGATGWGVRTMVQWVEGA